MKTIIALSLSAALLLSGCSSVPSNSAAIDVAGPAFLQTSTSIVAFEALKNNPKYAPDAVILGDAIDVVLGGTALINEQTIAAFVQGIAAKNHFDPAETLLFTGIAQTAYQAFAAKYNVTTGVLITDAKARAYVTAFRNGLRDALSMLGSTTTPKPV